MKIRLLVSVKIDKDWHEAGTIIDREDSFCGSLIRQKAAEVYEGKIMLTDPVNVDEEIEASEEDLTEMAEELCKIDGINSDLAYKLIEAGYGTIQSVAEAVPADLLAIKGIGKKTIKGIQESAEDLMENSTPDDDDF